MDALHQGIAVITQRLEQPTLKELLSLTKNKSLVIILDKITDPFNVGSILRSSKAFGAHVIITQTRNSPNETSIIAKTASGALEDVSICNVSNLATAIATRTEKLD